jgi:hypothetical protein
MVQDSASAKKVTIRDPCDSRVAVPLIRLFIPFVLLQHWHPAWFPRSTDADARNPGR